MAKNAKTVREFQYQGNFWHEVESWAAENGYKTNQEGSPRLYRKGKGWITAPIAVKLDQQGDQIRLEAWVNVDTLARLMSLFIVPSEMALESGGFRLAIPREIGRKEVNKLLNRLHQPEIP